MQAKFLPAPDTAQAYISAANDIAQANPVIAYGIACGVLLIAARYIARVL